MSENMSLQEKITFCAKLKGKTEPEMPTTEEYKKLTKQFDIWTYNGSPAEKKMVNHAIMVSFRGFINKAYPPGYAVSAPDEIKTMLKAEIVNSLPGVPDSEVTAIASVHLEQMQNVAYQIAKYSVAQRVSQIKERIDSKQSSTVDPLDAMWESNRFTAHSKQEAAKIEVNSAVIPLPQKRKVLD